MLAAVRAEVGGDETPLSAGLVDVIAAPTLRAVAQRVGRRER
jgi:hypothetical protein